MRTLQKDVYDALELSALVYGGIGKGSYAEPEMEGVRGAPVCAIGHARELDGHYPSWLSEENVVVVALAEAFGGYGNAIAESDDAVRLELTRPQYLGQTRIPFERWCELLDVVRGAE